MMGRTFGTTIVFPQGRFGSRLLVRSRVKLLGICSHLFQVSSDEDAQLAQRLEVEALVVVHAFDHAAPDRSRTLDLPWLQPDTHEEGLSRLVKVCHGRFTMPDNALHDRKDGLYDQTYSSGHPTAGPSLNPHTGVTHGSRLRAIPEKMSWGGPCTARCVQRMRVDAGWCLGAGGAVVRRARTSCGSSRRWGHCFGRLRPTVVWLGGVDHLLRAAW